MIVEVFGFGDVVQFVPQAPQGLAGNLGIVVGGVQGKKDVYVVESMQAGRLAVLDAVPGNVLRKIGRARYLRGQGGKWTEIGVLS